MGKQPLGAPLSLARQVIILCVANDKIMLDIPIHDIKDFQIKMLRFFEEENAHIVQEIMVKRKLDDELIATISEVANTFKTQYSSTVEV